MFLLIILVSSVSACPDCYNHQSIISGGSKLRLKRESTTSVAPHYLSKCGHSGDPNVTEEEDEFPHDLFTVEQLEHGAVVLHFLGLCYMFVALATVCDEFFVPALDIIVEKFNLSEDVAGATFMAAGGSAPELFAALIGLFISHSNVGIGTIVGSASFNILFVISMCTMFSATALHITWWPLFRDVSFYMLDLGLVIYFFMDEKIYWYEALILLLTYVCYVVFMKFNGQVETFVKTKIVLKFQRNTNRVVSSAAIVAVEPLTRKGSPQQVGSRPTTAGRVHGLHNIARIHGGSLLRQGIAHMMVQSLDPTHNVKNPLPHPAQNVDSKISLSYLHVSGLLTPIRVPIERPIERPIEENAESNSSLNHPNFTLAGEEDSMPEKTWANEGFVQPRRDSLILPPPKVVQSLSAVGGETTMSNGTNNTNEMKMVESKPGKHEKTAGAEEEEEEEEEESKPLDLSWPSSWKKRITYVLIMPILLPLWITIPDVRNPKKRKWFVVSFLVSIVWLGVFSYMTVWWATTIGHTLCIPNEIMGLTILAAGTSIPDMLNSIIVARRGLGDMAVSSSVGSNIFDITIGLNVPWLLWFMKEAIRGHPVSFISVQSNGLACSVGLLFVMIVFLITCIAIFKWRINKIFGVILLIGYGGYCAVIILIEMGKIGCPLKA